MIELNKIYNTDCIGPQGMCLIPDKSIDMILCDLPYGVTANKWDSVIPIDKLWEQYERIIKDDGPIILSGQGVFSAKLILSNERIYRYTLIWEKTNPSGFQNANKMPLRSHEDILIFYKKLPVYNPQKTPGEPYSKINRKANKGGRNYGEIKHKPTSENLSGGRFPKSVLRISNFNGQIFGKTKDATTHPTQKPVDLFRYLIKTYSHAGDTILDNCMGSGTTAIACVMEGRNYIGFENDTEHGYYNDSLERINKHKSQISMFDELREGGANA